jgi:hypothetical protein
MAGCISETSVLACVRRQIMVVSLGELAATVRAYQALGVVFDKFILNSLAARIMADWRASSAFQGYCATVLDSGMSDGDKVHNIVQEARVLFNS